jgi:integrase
MRHFLMTYIPGRKGWMREYKGKKYAVSCAQLGCPPTKEQSWLAANNWWERKQAQIDAQDQPVPATSVLDHISAALGVTLPADLAAQLLALKGQPPPPQLVTLEQAKERWLKSLLTSVSIKNIDISRYDAYKRYVGKFVEWAGPQADVRTLDAKKLESWWAHLDVCLAEHQYKPSTAQQALMTSKQFIRFLAQENLIPIPANFNDKHLRIQVPTQAPQALTLEEVRKLLNCDGSERSKLHVLLMLNCGMYQSHISDLGERQVDWVKGILTRPRSKRSDGVVTRYRLWEDTFELLKKHRARQKVSNDRGENRVLLSERGTPLVEFRREGTTMRRKDNIHTSYKRLAEQAGVDKPIKYLRKTSAGLLSTHSKYRYYVDHFLSHTPRSTSAKRDVVPNDDEFFEALAWLWDRYFEGVTWQATESAGGSTRNA